MGDFERIPVFPTLPIPNSAQNINKTDFFSAAHLITCHLTMKVQVPLNFN